MVVKLEGFLRLMAWVALGASAGCGGGGGGSSSPPTSLGTLSGTYDVNVSAELLVPTTVTAVTPSLPAGLRCSRASGTLPPGMTLSADCALSGSASESGRFVSQLTVTAPGYAGSASVAFSVQVEGPYLALFEPDNPRMLSAIDGNGKATVQSQGLFTVRPSDKTVYSITGGRLPNGVTLDPATGLLTGIPYETGKFAVTVGATLVRNGGQVTLTAVSREFYVLETAMGFSYYTSFIDPINLGPIKAVAPQVLNPLGALKSSKFEFIGTPPPGLSIDSSTGVIAGAADTPGLFKMAVRAFLAAPDGSQYAVDTQPVDVRVRGILPIYPRDFCGAAPCYVPYRSDDVTGIRWSYSLAPSAIFQGLPGDLYSYEILAPATPRKLPTWASVDANTGVVTIGPVGPASDGPYGMVLKVTTVRSGKAIVDYLRWDFELR